MQTELRKSKNYFTVKIPNSIAEDFNLNIDTKLYIKMQRGKIILTKKEKLSELCEKINDKNLNTDETYQIRGREW